jgi:predicted CXXCH cytochrome family protein
VLLGPLAATFLGSAWAGQERPTEITDTCADAGCHADIANLKFVHRTAARDGCLDCHEFTAVEQHLFRLVRPLNELCQSCHELEIGTAIHEPVETGDCTGCHDHHGSTDPMLLILEDEQELCATCHDPEPYDKTYLHGPVAVSECIVCHDSHSSSHEMLLTMAPRKLCLDCHPESAPKGAAARHQHQPNAEGCTVCHTAHASDIMFQLHDAGADLCYPCHEGIRNLVAAANVVHSPTVEGDACIGCHDSHFSRLPYLQKAPQMTLCLDCHNEPLETTDGRQMADMATMLAENPNHHGPIREGVCTTCHQAHAGEHFRLLLMEYPPEFYAPFETQRYALCFSCHLSDLVQEESGTGLTGFRDGDLNLHWRHVNQEKGRTCRACHEVHASRRPFHIREAVPYGEAGWMLPISYERTAGGGRCAPGCHKARSYSRSGQPPAGREAISDKGVE